MTDGNADIPVHEPRLSADDQRLLDALMESGFDRNILSAVSREDNRRLDAICDSLELLNDYPVEDADETLIHATLARIDRYEDAQAARMKIESRQGDADGERRGWRIRVPDFITVAAVILIGVSVLWPVLNDVRHESMKVACGNNLKTLGYAFGQYAADNNGSMPLAMAGFGAPSMSWDKVSNVVNLEPLVRGNYCELDHLNCPGHEHDGSASFDPGYSYRQFAQGANTNWGSMRVTVILGDLNPIVDAARAGRFISPLSISLNHAGRGQNILVSDGSTSWLEDPVFLRNDNIWLPRGTVQLRGGEEPADDVDVFLTQ